MYLLSTRFTSIAAQLATAILAPASPLVLAQTADGTAPALPSREQILEDLRLANRYFVAKWPDPGADIVTDRTRPSNIWTRAVYYEGLMALYAVDPRAEYYDYAVSWGEAHDWELGDGSRLLRNADFQAAGQTYIDLYRIDPVPERIRSIKTSIDAMLATDKIDDWNWIDAIQMAMPVFAKLGVLEHDERYWDRMYAMYRYTRDRHGDHGLFDPTVGLWWRDADYDPPHRSPNGRDVFWSRGNGWVFAGLARVLDVIPENAPHRSAYLEDFRTMAAALVARQRSDGFWNVSLDDPGQFGGPETSGTALFAYGLAFGIDHGLLDSERYRPAVAHAWHALATDALHPDGFLGFIQGTGKEPASGQPVTYDNSPDFEDFGLGVFLLAGSEVYRLAR